MLVKDHLLQRCKLFRAKTPANHGAVVWQKELFFKSLGYHKSPMYRSENKEHKCDAKHNTLLHGVLSSNAATAGLKESIASAVVLT